MNISVALDSGKGYTKGLCPINKQQLQKVRFRTKVQELVDNLDMDVSPNSYIVRYSPRNYLVGDMVSESKVSPDLFEISKTSISHLISIYTAISLFLQKAGISETGGIPTVQLGINTPLNVYKNAKLKEDFKRYVTNENRTVSLRVNGKPYIFKIQDCILLPEGVGSVFAKLNEFKNKRVMVWDIGFLNTNFCIYENLIPIVSSMLISSHGISRLRGDIQQALSSRFGTEISVDDSERILRDGVLYINGERVDESKALIEKVIESHVKQTVNFLRNNGLSLNNIHLLVCGGGSVLLKNAISNEFPHAIFDDNVELGNIYSYLKIMEAKGLVSPQSVHQL